MPAEIIPHKKQVFARNALRRGVFRSFQKDTHRQGEIINRKQRGHVQEKPVSRKLVILCAPLWAGIREEVQGEVRVPEYFPYFSRTFAFEFPWGIRSHWFGLPVFG